MQGFADGQRDDGGLAELMREPSFDGQESRALRAMQDELRTLTSRIRDLEQLSDAKTPTQHAVEITSVLPRLNLVDWTGFQKSTHTGERFAIDILVGSFNDPPEYPPRKALSIDPLDYEGQSIGHNGLKPLPEGIRINSKTIIRLLSKAYGSEVSPNSVPIIFPRPFRSLFFYEDKIRGLILALKTLLKSKNDHGIPHESRGAFDEDEYAAFSKSLNELNCIICFMDIYLKPRLSYLRGASCSRVVFSDLWLLFKPGDHVLSQDRRRAYCVIGLSAPWQRDIWLAGDQLLAHETTSDSEGDEDNEITIECVFIASDGQQVGAVTREFSIPEFWGVRDVMSLAIHPISLAHKDLVSSIRERGRLFARVAANSTHMHYRGMTSQPEKEIDEPVIIDFEQAQRFGVDGGAWTPHIVELSQWDQHETHPNAETAIDSQCVHDDSHIEAMKRNVFIQAELECKSLLLVKPERWKDNVDMTEDNLLITTPYVFGFALNWKAWAKFDIVYLIAIQDEADFQLSQLVLPNGCKETITELISGFLVGSQLSHRQRHNLIISLRGYPGVGKTMTAKCMANHYRRPMFQLTTRDLFSKKTEVQNQIEGYFALASRWGCFMLIDDADAQVFVGKKPPGQHPEQIQVMTVFLSNVMRSKGVLFLITNNAANFDEAFMSLVHVNLLFPPLDKDATLKLFENNIQRLRDKSDALQQEECGTRLVVKMQDILSFAAAYFDRQPHARWNGRTIRNGFDTALSLVQHKANGSDRLSKGEVAEVTLDARQFEAVAETYLGISYPRIPPPPPFPAPLHQPVRATPSEDSFGRDGTEGYDSDASTSDSGHTIRAETKRHARKGKQSRAGALITNTTAYALSNTLSFTATPSRHHVKWEAFRDGRVNRDNDRFAIEVLDGEPVVKFDVDPSEGFWWSKWAHRRDSDHATKDAAGDANTLRGQTLPPGQAPLPERIRIHSKQIVKVLETIHGSELSSYETSVVMIRPFRALAYYERKIRQKLEDAIQSIMSPIQTQENRSDTGNSIRQRGNPGSKPDDGVQTEVTPTAAVLAARGDESDDRIDSENADSHSSVEHLQCLVDFIDTELRAKVLHLSHPSCHTVVFTDLWYMFKPGDEVVEPSRRQAFRILSVTSQLHKVVPPWVTWKSRNKRAKEKSPVEPSITLHCVYIDFDGYRLGPVRAKFEIKKFDGSKDITSLPAYPLRFAKTPEPESSGDGHSSFRARLISRGRKFVNVIGITPMHYNGVTLDSKEEVDSQVIVDFQECLSALAMERPLIEELVGTSIGDSKDDELCNAECCAGEEIHQDAYAERNINQEYISTLIPGPEDGNQQPSVAVMPRLLHDKMLEELSEDDLIIMSNRVFGFILRSRKWAELDLRHLTPIGSEEKIPHKEKEQRRDNHLTGTMTRNTNSRTARSTLNAVPVSGTEPSEPMAFDQLVLPRGHKEIVVSLIAQHFHDRETQVTENEQTDIIRGKGKGLIILLHGAPGVGKTTTAEGVAEVFNKPLFQITCGDLGTTASDVEKALERHFSLASRWGCVLLLDEADVFLSERSPQDFKRNSFVAVFLRALEYYKGILFLTTNRIGDFDEAFASRVHISLYYPPLDKEATEKIFMLNLQLLKERVERRGLEIEIDDAILRFAANYWDKYAKMRWNGRQIRNACQTALALAQYDAQRGQQSGLVDTVAFLKEEVNNTAKVYLTEGHMETVANAYLEFMKYLKEVHGRDAERRAKSLGIRAREIPPPSVGTKSKGDGSEENEEEEVEGLLRIRKEPASRKDLDQGMAKLSSTPSQTSSQSHWHPALTPSNSIEGSQGPMNPSANVPLVPVSGTFSPAMYQPGFPPPQQLAMPIYGQALDPRQAYANYTVWQGMFAPGAQAPQQSPYMGSPPGAGGNTSYPHGHGTGGI